MDTSVLENLGLSKSEIKTYLALLELGASSARGILEKTGLHNSVMHLSLNGLIVKGLATYIKKGKIRIYQAAPPEALLGYMDDQRSELQRMIPELKRREEKSSEKEEVEIFDGMRGIATALNLLIENAKKGDEFLFFSSDSGEKDKEIQAFHERYDGKRKEKHLIVKGIAPVGLKEQFKERGITKMKYVDFPIPENTGICNNKMVIFSWGAKPKAIFIPSKTIVEKEKKFFNEVWKMI